MPRADADTCAAADPVVTPAGQARPGAGPVVVLSYPFAGAELLTGVLSASSSLACTSGTGLIPLCHAALACWQQADDRAGPPPALAIKTVRILVGTMVTTIQARVGGVRWCETALAHPAAAGSFLQVFPSTVVVCVYRDLPGVLADGLRAYPWGLGGSPFWSHSAGHPGNSVATIAQYWAASSEALLDFEAKHSSSCLRVKHEDLAATPVAAVTRILSHLRLDAGDVAAIPAQAEATARPAAAPDVGVTGQDVAAYAAETPLPAELIPPGLLGRISRIQTELGYDALVKGKGNHS